MPDNTTLTQKLAQAAPVRFGLTPKAEGGALDGVAPGSPRAAGLARQLQAELEGLVTAWDRRDEAVLLDCPLPTCTGQPPTTAGAIVRGETAVCPVCGAGCRVTPGAV